MKDYQVMGEYYPGNLHITRVVDGNYPGNVNYQVVFADYQVMRRLNYQVILDYPGSFKSQLIIT